MTLSRVSTGVARVRSMAARPLCIPFGLALISGVFAIPAAFAETGQAADPALLQRLERLERRLAAEERLRSPAFARGSVSAPQLSAPDATWQSPYTNLVAAPQPPTEQQARALERALVQEGGLLLEPWRLELEPRIEYSHRNWETMRLARSSGGEAVLLEEQQRQHSVEGSLSARIGLPVASQFEVEARYLTSHQLSVNAGGAEREDSTGLDSIRAGLTTQFVGESGGVPALLGNVGYTEAFGEKRLGSFSGLRVHGAGFDAVDVGLTAVRSQDPLVFFLSGSYSRAFAETVDGQKVRPGDLAGGKLGTILAVNPSTSLQLGFEAVYAFDAELNGQEVEGSGDLAALLEIGASTILSDTTLLTVTAGAGLTEAAPDVRLGLSVSQGLW